MASEINLSPLETEGLNLETPSAAHPATLANRRFHPSFFFPRCSWADLFQTAAKPPATDFTMQVVSSSSRSNETCGSGRWKASALGVASFQPQDTRALQTGGTLQHLPGHKLPGFTLEPPVSLESPSKLQFEVPTSQPSIVQYAHGKRLDRQGIPCTAWAWATFCENRWPCETFRDPFGY